MGSVHKKKKAGGYRVPEGTTRHGAEFRPANFFYLFYRLILQVSIIVYRLQTGFHELHRLAPAHIVAPVFGGFGLLADSLGVAGAGGEPHAEAGEEGGEDRAAGDGGQAGQGCFDTGVDRAA